MDKKIVWSKTAKTQLFEILNYWENRNQSQLYSIKLKAKFDNSLRLIAKYPEIGKPTENPKIKLNIVRDYILAYEILAKIVLILEIWDTRQDADLFLYFNQ